MKNKKYLIAILTSFFILFGINSINGIAKVSVLNNSPEEIKRIEKFLKENDNLLNENEKEGFNIIKEKLKRFEVLSQGEMDYMRECERNIIRSKLGDLIYEEYCKLIKKRASKAEFTPPERFRLLEIEKQIRGSK